LPPVLPQISDPSHTETSPLATSLQVFHSKLKTLLFSKSHPDFDFVAAVEILSLWTINEFSKKSITKLVTYK